MFEALGWRRPPFRTEAAIHYAADGLAHARRNPIVLGSLAAVALLGAFARVGLNRAWFQRTWDALRRRKLVRSRATVIPARVRASVEKAMPANGRRRRRRKRKAATHA
jgi:hypothetical protein